MDEQVSSAPAKAAISQSDHQENRVRTIPLQIYVKTPMSYHVGPPDLSQLQINQGALLRISTILIDDATPPEPVPETTMHIFTLPRWFASKKGIETRP